MTKKIKKRPVKGFRCSFCGKQGESAGLLVVGQRGHICENCVTMAIITCAERGVNVVGPAFDIIQKRNLERGPDEPTASVDND